MESLVAQLIAVKGVVIAAWFAVLFAAERWRPAAPVPAEAAGWRRLARNGGLFLINTALSPLIVVPITALAAGHAPDWRPDWWAGAPGLVLDLILLDAWIYGWHRINHRLPVLWRFHEVHHLDRFLDTTSAVRFHAGEVVLSSLVRASVIFLLGVPLAHVVVFETLVMVAALFHHSNLRLPEGLERSLGILIVTPRHHRMHHAPRRCDTDSNYATILSVWDRMFATRCAGGWGADARYGVDGRAERDLKGLLLRPLDPP